MMRVDDLRAVADVPTFILLPASVRYDRQPVDVVDGLALYGSPSPERHRLLLQQPIAPLSFGRYAPLSVTTMTLDARTFGMAKRYGRHWRRREARSQGRRRARPVPLRVEWEVRVLAEAHVEDHVIERIAWRHAVVVTRTWRHGDAVDWARRAMRLRQRADRKRARARAKILEVLRINLRRGNFVPTSDGMAAHMARMAALESKGDGS